METCKSLPNQRENSLLPFCLLSSNNRQHSAILVSVSPLFFFLLGYFKENIIHLYFNPKYFSIYLLKKRTSGAFSPKEKLRSVFQNAGPRDDSLSWNWVLWLLGLLNSWYGVQVKLTLHLSLSLSFSCSEPKPTNASPGKETGSLLATRAALSASRPGGPISPALPPWPSVGSSPAPVSLHRAGSPADLLGWTSVLVLGEWVSPSVWSVGWLSLGQITCDQD